MSTSGPGDDNLRVAAVQAAPVFLDRKKTVDKACALIREAASNGARLITFGEGFLPAHPTWFHFFPATHPHSIELTTALVHNAISIPGPETETLGDAAREAGAMVVMGVVERPDASRSVIFDSQLAISPDGSVQGARRKLVPAVGERIVFTAGSGDSIRVFDSPWGPVSALLGGENANPLLTYTMRSLGARIHVAAWPPHFNKPRIMQETVTVTGRAIAYQNSAYVIAVTGAIDDEAVRRVALGDAERKLLQDMAVDPGSVVFAPRGATHKGPQPGGESILYAELDLSAGTWAQLVNRQYDRPDLFHLSVDREPAPAEIDFGASAPHGSDRASATSLVRARYAGQLSEEDIERLIPYAEDILRRSQRLAANDPTRDDPNETPFATDPRLER